ncbi:MAG TPA: hypothetical protein VEU62_12090 [Bryobacterales bacterium]|nr:hypothetical protein [Bryobacterales bacterium]
MRLFRLLLSAQCAASPAPAGSARAALRCARSLAAGAAWLVGAWLASGVLPAQTLSNASLNAKFYFAQLLVTTTSGQATNAQNMSGSITFDGKGGYTFAAKLGSGSGALSPMTGSGTYSVSSAGNVTLTNPIKSSLQVSARLSGDGIVIVGASTEATDASNDIFVAIKAPTATVTNAILIGAYTGASMQFPNGASAAMKSAVVQLAASGNGQFSSVTVIGHSADQSGNNLSQNATGVVYSIKGDGSGTLDFGAAAPLLTGLHEIWVSQDGSYLLGYSTANGGRDIFIATKNFSASATPDIFNGRYWIAELTFDGSTSSFSCAGGAVQALGNGRVLISERLKEDLPPPHLDFSGINGYAINADSTGNLSPFVQQGVNNMALGVSATVSGKAVPNTVVGAQIGIVSSPSFDYGIFFAVRAPTLTGTGVFIDPSGVVNNASFAPSPSPIAPGLITSLFGSGLATGTTVATTIPLQTTLGGVSVLVNGTPAPLFHVLPGQIDFETPYGITGNSVTVQVNNNGAMSNQITVPLAPANPGIFEYSDTVSPNRGIVLHTDFSLVTTQSPAKAGETVVIYLTGLGALNPAVTTGAANPSAAPLATATDPNIQILFGGEVATQVQFIGGAPGFVGLNQINATIPLTTLGGGPVPVAIATSNAFTDVVDIPMQ